MNRMLFTALILVLALPALAQDPEVKISPRLEQALTRPAPSVDQDGGTWGVWVHFTDKAIAETDLGRKIVTNIVMLGYFTAVTEAVPKEAMIEAIKSSVPKGTIDLNLQAFERGYDAFAEG